MASICTVYKWLGCPVFKWHLKTRLFGIQPLFDHLNIRLVQYSDPHCNFFFSSIRSPMSEITSPIESPSTHLEAGNDRSEFTQRIKTWRLKTFVKMENCTSLWHSWTNCLDSVEHCESGYCVLNTGIISLIGIVVMFFLLAFSADFAFAPTIQNEHVLANVLLFFNIVLILISMSFIIAGTTFAFM